ncbi:unnamed protein product, partial [marine sediment metagenome]
MTEEQRFYCEDFTGRGIRLYPISRNKKPLIKDWPNKATTDMAQVALWGTKWPSCNFCALAGKGSGVLILDVDVKNNQPGLESLARLEEEYGSFDTFTVKTPSGGLHLYFKYPEGQEMRNINNFPDHPGMELKAYHAGCVIPGSVYSNG